MNFSISTNYITYFTISCTLLMPFCLHAQEPNDTDPRGQDDGVSFGDSEEKPKLADGWRRPGDPGCIPFPPVIFATNPGVASNPPLDPHRDNASNVAIQWSENIEDFRARSGEIAETLAQNNVGATTGDGNTLPSNHFVSGVFNMAGSGIFPTTSAGFPATADTIFNHGQDLGFDGVDLGDATSGDIVTNGIFMGIVCPPEDGVQCMIYPSSETGMIRKLGISVAFEGDIQKVKAYRPSPNLADLPERIAIGAQGEWVSMGEFTAQRNSNSVRVIEEIRR